MRTVSPQGYHHNGFVATHALGHMIFGYHVRLVPTCAHIYIYIYIYIYYIYILYVHIYGIHH